MLRPSSTSSIASSLLYLLHADAVPRLDALGRIGDFAAADEAARQH